MCICWCCSVLRCRGSYKGKAEVGTVPSMEKVYHALIAGTIRPDEKGVRCHRADILKNAVHYAVIGARDTLSNVMYNSRARLIRYTMPY